MLDSQCTDQEASDADPMTQGENKSLGKTQACNNTANVNNSTFLALLPNK